MYCYSAGLTAVQVLSRPTPPGPRPLHGGKQSVVPSLIVRTPFSQVFLGHPAHRERLNIPDESHSVSVTSWFQASQASRPRHSRVQFLQVLRAVSCFGVPRGGRCPPRTVSLQQAKRLAAQSADVPGSHVHTFLAVPYHALPLMLVRPLVHANGVHGPVSPPGLSTPPVPPSSASTLTQLFHPRCHVSRLERWDLESTA